jgi:acyl-CoA synthetase (AMP-forming)/AMP-acid ligase II
MHGHHHPNAPVTADELREFASARLAKFQVPRLWEFRDSLPKTPTQRIEKYKLRQESGGSDKPLLG